jgi:hypothetical protein
MPVVIVVADSVVQTISSLQLQPSVLLRFAVVPRPDALNHDGQSRGVLSFRLSTSGRQAANPTTQLKDFDDGCLARLSAGQLLIPNGLKYARP